MDPHFNVAQRLRAFGATFGGPEIDSFEEERARQHITYEIGGKYIKYP